MTQPIDRAKAARLTLITQGMAVALAVGAVAAAVTGLPERPTPQTDPSAIPSPGAPTPAQNAQVTNASELKIDPIGLAARLSLIENAPKIAKPEPGPSDPGTDPEPDPGEPTPQPFASRVRYLGVIHAGNGNAAFVNIDNKQRIVRQGQTVPAPAERPELGALTIERITGHMLVVSHGSDRATIDLADRTGPAITMVAGGEVARVETPQAEETRDLSGVVGGRDIRQSEIDRRQRIMERQRAGIRNSNPEAQLRPPPARNLNMNPNARNRGANNQAEPAEQPSDN